MIVTEQQAKDLTCPRFVAMQMGYGHNGCLGSQCMWWAWSLQATPQRRRCPNETAMVERHRMAGLPDDWTFVPYDEVEGTWAHWLEPQAQADARRTGCCGVAHQ